MRKGILEFDLDDPESQSAHLRATKADKAYSALSSIQHDLFRRYRKYGLPPNLANLSPQDLIEQLEEEFHSILRESSIDLDEEY